MGFYLECAVEAYRLRQGITGPVDGLRGYFGNRKNSLQPSAADIVSISTGRESLLIGPSSAFGAKTRNLVIRDRIHLRHALDVFMTRPGAIALLRPNLRRWGIPTAHSYLNERDAIKDALSRAIASGRLAIAVIPEVTMAFSKVHATAGRTLTLAIPAPVGNLFPDGMQDRLVLVIEKVPAHMTGATRQAFEDALANTGIGIIVGGLMTWVGAHLVPGVNVAVLAFDLFFLGSDVIRACETIGSTLDDIAKAKSHEDLEPAAKVIAGAIAVLLVAGIFSRLMKAKQVTKGPAKRGGHRSVEKPGGGPKEKRKAREPRRAAQEIPATPKTTKLSLPLTKRTTSGVKIKPNPNKTTTILGTYKHDIQHVINEANLPKSNDLGPRVGGYNVLNVEDAKFYKDGKWQAEKFWDEVNEPFLKAAIDRGDDIVLATHPNANTLNRVMGDGTMVQSGFGREYEYLLKHGYTYDKATSTMIKVPR